MFISKTNQIYQIVFMKKLMVHVRQMSTCHRVNPAVSEGFAVQK